MRMLHRIWISAAMVLRNLRMHARRERAEGSGESRKPPATFAPLEQWKAAVLAGDAAKLRALYSTNPEARVILPSGETNAQTEIAFWTGLKARRHEARSGAVRIASRPDCSRWRFRRRSNRQRRAKLQTVYVIDGQLWQKQGEQWRIAATHAGRLTRLQQPLRTDKEIYVPGLNAHAEIAQALKLAAQQHKRVLVVFGANWCFDCHVLDLAFHRPDVAAVLTPNYEVVHVDVGRVRQEPGHHAAI